MSSSDHMYLFVESVSPALRLRMCEEPPKMPVCSGRHKWHITYTEVDCSCWNVLRESVLHLFIAILEVLTAFCVCRYKSRCLEAMRAEKGKIMSIIIDKMDSNHCKCPFLGTQVSFSHPLNVGITGVLEHGVGKRAR